MPDVRYTTARASECDSDTSPLVSTALRRPERSGTVSLGWAVRSADWSLVQKNVALAEDGNSTKGTSRYRSVAS